MSSIVPCARCGWIDLVALKYAVMINGVSQLIMMKSDVLDSFETIKACVAYKINGEEVTEFPFEIDDTIEPVYVELPGWKTDMTKMQSEDYRIPHRYYAERHPVPYSIRHRSCWKMSRTDKNRSRCPA